MWRIRSDSQHAATAERVLQVSEGIDLTGGCEGIEKMVRGG